MMFLCPSCRLREQLGSTHLRSPRKSVMLQISHCLELGNSTRTINLVIKEALTLWRKKVSESNLFFQGGLNKTPNK